MPNKRPGRPSKRSTVIDHDEDGKPITVQQQLLSDIAMGIPVDRACARAGIVSETYYDWLRTGNRLRTAPPRNLRQEPRPLTRSEKELCQFSVDALKAEADGMTRLALHVVEAATTKQLTTTTTTVTNIVNGQPVVTRTVVVREEPPEWRAAIELLQRRWPREWGRLDRHEHTGEDGEPIPIAMRIEHILGQVEQVDKLYAVGGGGSGSNGRGEAIEANGKIIELNPGRNGDTRNDTDDESDQYD